MNIVSFARQTYDNFIRMHLPDIVHCLLDCNLLHTGKPKTVAGREKTNNLRRHIYELNATGTQTRTTPTTTTTKKTTSDCQSWQLQPGREIALEFYASFTLCWWALSQSNFSCKMITEWQLHCSRRAKPKMACTKSHKSRINIVTTFAPVHIGEYVSGMLR